MTPQATKEFFGRRDPTRFGSGMLLGKGLQDPLFKLLPPFAGNQIEKTIQGVGSVAQGYETNKNDQITYPIHQSASNYLKGFLFGKYSVPEATQYYREQEKPLGVDDTIVLRAILNENEDQGFAYYQSLLTKRDVQSVINDVRAEVTKAKLIITNPNATEEDKQGAYNAIQKQAIKAQDKLKSLMGKEVDISAIDKIVKPLNGTQDFTPIDSKVSLPPTIATKLSGTGGKKVAFKATAIPKGKAISMKIAKPKAQSSSVVAGIKKLSPPPKSKGVKIAKGTAPKFLKPRRFKVSKLRVTA
jgi:hypothetical protein